MKLNIQFEQMKMIENLAKEGCSIQEIAVKVGIGKTSVREEFKRCGGKKYYTAEESKRVRNEVWENRRKKYIKYFDEEEEKQMHQLIKSNCTKTQIIKKMRTSHNRVENWIKENYPGHRGGRVINLQLEVDGIKQQLEIIIDLIKSKL